MAWTSIDLTIAACSLAVILLLKRVLTKTVSNTPLNGPPSSSFITGALMDVFLNDDPPSVYLPRGIGASSTVICDPKAAQHVLGKDTSLYVNTPFRSAFLKQTVKEHWETLIAQNDGVQTVAPIAKIFESFSKHGISHFSRITLIAAQIFPILRHLPTKGKRKRASFTKEGSRVAKAMIDKADAVMENGDEKLAASLLQRLKLHFVVRAQKTEAATLEEVTTQVTTFLIAGYETTSVTMTFHGNILHIQILHGTELWYETPYLDAVIMENLRLHPLVPEIPRMAAQDDIIPLSKPLETSQGTFTDALTIRKGSYVTVPIGALNRLPELWGPDAGRFNPDRWLGGGIDDKLGANELKGLKHLLTFSDGPRICLGRHFALAEMKAVLVAVSRNFMLEFEDPTQTQLEMHIGFAPRPKMKGSKEASIPLRIRKVE
ncbi:cytochrome P450 [Flagelloscypha sp. PMI_526]|nr:cytochrome P450 [Flagelloscypha sp. PMI_526]